MNIFEKASKTKLRFSTSKGQLSVEEMWDLSLTSLDNIHKSISKGLKDDSGEGLFTTQSDSYTEDHLRLDVIKHIFVAKQEAATLVKAKQEKQTHLYTLKQLKETKEIEALGSKSLEDIDKMIAELES